MSTQKSARGGAALHKASRFRYRSIPNAVSVQIGSKAFLTRSKSGKSTLALAHAMIKRVQDGLLPTEEAVAGELDRALKVLAPYRNADDLKRTRHAR